MRTKLEIVKKVVEEQQYTKIKMLIRGKSKYVLLDGTTASRILKLFNSGNVDEINALPWRKLVNLAWTPYNKESEV